MIMVPSLRYPHFAESKSTRQIHENAQTGGSTFTSRSHESFEHRVTRIRDKWGPQHDSVLADRSKFSTMYSPCLTVLLFVVRRLLIRCLDDQTPLRVPQNPSRAHRILRVGRSLAAAIRTRALLKGPIRTRIGKSHRCRNV